MLHRAGNAERNIELAVGRNGARLADLMGFRQPAGIGDRTRAAEGGAEALGKLGELLHVLLVLDRAPDGKNEIGLANIHVGGRRRLIFHMGGPPGERRKIRRNFRDGGIAFAFGREERGAARHQRHAALAGKAELDIDFAAIAAASDRYLAAISLDIEHIRGEAAAQAGGDRRAVSHAACRMGDEDCARRPLAGQRTHRFLIERGVEMGVGRGDAEHFVDAVEIGGRGQRLVFVADDGHHQLRAERVFEAGGGADHLAGDIAQGPIHMFGDNENSRHLHSPRFLRTISAIALATSAAPPSSISAWPDLTGTLRRLSRAPA